METKIVEAVPPLSEPAPNLPPAALQWPVVALGAPLGLPVAAVTIIGLGNLWWEAVAWAVVGFAWIGLVWWKAPARPFAHGFLASSAGGLVVIVLQAVFIEAFLRAHPTLAASLAANALSPRWFVFGTGVIGTAVTAGLVGLFAAFASPAARGRDED